jgi:hypothetical protein
MSFLISLILTIIASNVVEKNVFFNNFDAMFPSFEPDLKEQVSS